MLTAAEKQAMKKEVISTPYPELLTRQQFIVERLGEIGIDDPFQSARQRAKNKKANPSILNNDNVIQPPSESSGNLKRNPPVPYDPKTDVHWDFVMKEMMWLSVDFQGERKRQISLAKKQATALQKFHATKEKRRLRKLAEAEMKKRRLASKMARDVVKGWWHAKIERVIAYKQKVDADLIRKRGMDRQLVFLVKQTERYTNLLNEQLVRDGGGGSSSRNGKRMTIEEALQDPIPGHDAPKVRSSRQRHRDYQSLANQLNETDDTEFYGESTEDEGESGMEDYYHEYNVDDTDSEDDETTLLEAEAIEQSSGQVVNEANLLLEESQMDIEDVLKRFEEERDKALNGGGLLDETIQEKLPATLEKEEVDTTKRKRVKFESSVADDPSVPSSGAVNKKKPSDSPKKDSSANDGNDADDDADMSDVDDFKDSNNESNNGDSDNEEFTINPADASCIDDESTLEAEMRLKPEMDPNDEIAMLKKEAEMSVEELRAVMYGAENEDTNLKIDEEEAGNVDDESMASRSTNESEEFVNDDMDAVDDETTLEAEMRLKPEMDPNDEIAMLKKEAEMSVEELRAMMYGAENEDTNVEKEEGEGDNESMASGSTNESEEFVNDDMDAVDDETTLEAEMRLKPEMNPEDEIALLKKENEMSIDELRAKYAIYEDNDNGDENNDTGNSDVEDEGAILGDGSSIDDVLSVDDAQEKDEFIFDGSKVELDDETTIEAEEKLGRDITYEEEINLLKAESEMSIEELRAKYYQAEDEGSQGNSKSAQEEDDEETSPEDEEDFEPLTGGDLDDETTIEAEERLGRDMTYDEEINLLKRENEMSVEELRAMYMNVDEADGAEDASEDSSYSGKQLKRTLAERDDSDDEDNHEDSKKIKLTRPQHEACDEEEDEGTAALRTLEVADAKARNTAVSRPYLISSWVKLRAYQQVGLNWLVSIQTRRLNGILADEMGLGKTLQTISLLSYLAAYKGIWGPHLIVVPTSCIVNWETEIKRFCPAFKVLCYYGSAKRRKELRQGWTKTNWNHIVITSYQLVVQDSFAFRRKKWYYMVLDEAHNIKNFQSQRWQTLIHFNTQRRLLLTGTPLQNNLMELWSLLHFLMPHVFRSRKEFSYWFSNPMNNIIEGNASRNDSLIGRLHGIIRPFVLRRLKKDVETQMPGKFEHIVKCHLSRRQMFLYEEFMARSSTRAAMSKGGNYMGMMNVLMQLRKVCNHPDLFEARSIVTPLSMERISFVTAACVVQALEVNSPLLQVSCSLLQPIWSLGAGLPSFEDSVKQSKRVTARRNQLQIDGTAIKKRVDSSLLDEPLLKAGGKSGISRLLQNIYDEAKSDRQRNAQSQIRLNMDRCDGRSFLYPDDLQESVQIHLKSSLLKQTSHFTYSQIASNPNELLEMKASQEKVRQRQTDDLTKHFVFVVPRAGSHPPALFPKRQSTKYDRKLLESISDTNVLNDETSGSLFFPDKKLIQFDAGKLQILSELLRTLKQGKHRVLIFTQMSKMLDILEAFLNLNGHTYLRLDGGTGVDQRQRLMDRFNNDEKMFCFILSTRSGGLGINLTGADTVVFYDSDWNPAMDAQAQDRAHRIGQTRDVHIYRLVTEHSIEENILVKAKQKRHLDFLVMDEGKFHADADKPSAMDVDEAKEEESGPDFDISSKGGLRNILGVTGDNSEDTEEEIVQGDATKGEGGEVSKEQLESTLAKLEDEDDVLAMRGARQEAEAELKEFDENAQVSKDDDSQGSQEEDKTTKKKQPGPSNEEKSDDEDQNAKMEKEFAAWQAQVGVDQASIDASLNPVERYALRFKEDINPFYSMWYLSEQQRIQEMEATDEQEWDIGEIEAMKAEQEANAIEDGDLLATLPEPSDLLRQRHLYFREKSRLVANKKRRKLTGENWSTKIDGKTKLPFWYNSDTGEAIWEKPAIIHELEEYDVAAKLQWNAVPMKPLVNVMKFLLPYPERTRCASACKQWRRAAQGISFVRHVFPVEMGALTMNPDKMDHNHFRTFAEALQYCLPGDTIELGDGHYWINEDEISIDFPLRIIGDEKDPSHVVIELGGTIGWKGKKGYIEGVTFRRPRIGSGEKKGGELLRIEDGSSLNLVSSAIEGTKDKVEAPSGFGFNEHGVILRGNFTMKNSTITNIQGNGIECHDGSVATLSANRIVGNAGCAIQLNNGSTLNMLDKNMFGGNTLGAVNDKRTKMVKEEIDLVKS